MMNEMGEVLQLHLAHLTLPNGVDRIQRRVIMYKNHLIYKGGNK
jgi:hypothetical protein